MKRIYSEVRSLWSLLHVASLVRAFIIPGLVLCSTLPAAAVFKVDLQGYDFGTTNWSSGPLLGWRELDAIPCRVFFTGGPQSNYVVTITFDHTRGTSRGIEDLTGFTPSTNVIINSGPTLSAPAGVDIWSYTLNVTVTDAAPAQILYFATLSAGSHNFGGASLAMGGVAQLQIQKSSVVLGSPDMVITKSGATQARTNQILTYVITWTNRLVAADTATGVQVIDTLPPQVTYVPGSGSKGVKVLGNTLTWNLGNVAPGRSGFLTYKVMVTNNIPVTTTFANYAQIVGSQNDANPADNVASVTTTVVVIPTPLAADDFYAIGKNQTLTVAAPGVLLNDSNALSGSLLAGPANGSLTFNTNGSFIYVPGTNFLGSDYFAYRSFNSSNMSGPAIVTIDVTNTCFVIGTINTITNNDPGLCGAVVNFPLPITTGDCANFVFSPTNGSFFPIGTSTVTFTNTDGVSNSFQVTVLDTELPTVACPNDMVLSANAGQCSRSNVTFLVTAADNCTVTNLVSIPASGSTFPAGVTTVTNIATDASGNQVVCTFTVTVVDSQGPVLTCPANFVVNAAAGQCTSNVTFSVTANDVCGSITNLVSVPASGFAFPVGVTTVTNTATDNSGNTSTCTFTVTVVDTQPPTITCPATVNVVANNGACAATNVSLGTPIGSDNCSVVSITNNAPTTFPVGTNLVMWTATDTSGNTTTCQQLVVVQDNQSPVITCPTNLAVNATVGQCTSNVSFIVTASDACGSVANLVSVPASGSAFPVGVTTVTNTATDNSGNISICTFTVTVLDIQPPTITCPATVNIAANNGTCAATNVSLGTPIAGDSCSGVSITNNAPAFFPVGTNLVTWTASDASGNTATCQQLVVVHDNQPPVISCPADITVNGTVGLCSASGVVLGSATASDNCGAVAVTNDAPAQFPVGTNVVIWTATDASGNTSTCQQRVIVLDTQPPTLNCPASLVLEADPGQCSRSNVTFVVTAADNCGAVSVVSIPPSGSTFPLGTTTVTNIATDASGNQTICTFTVNAFSVTINDIEPPVINCPTNLVLTADAGECSRSNVTFLVTATDNCTVTNLVSIPASSSAFPVGVTTVTNIATDAGGNQAVCTFTVTVLDVDAPTINCPADLFVTFPPGITATNVSFLVTATDACGVSSLQSVPPNGSIFSAGVTTVTNTATDVNGNTSTCTFTITATVANSAPVANSQSVSAPEDTTLPITLTGSDFDGNPLTYILVSGPTNGGVSGFNTNTGALTYTPNTNYTGSDSFTFRINDGQTLSAVAMVSITVTPVNDAPFANNQSITTPEDTALPLTLTGSDVEGDPLTYILVSGPANGALSGFNTNTGALTYTPATNYNGADSFTFRTSDGTNTSAVATVGITITPVNDAPFANDQSVSTPEDTALPITLTGSDVEGTPLTFILVSGPANGALSGFNTNTGALTYLPSTNYNGADAFTFRTSDGTNTSAVATVAITVTPVNDAPYANNDFTGTPKNVPVTIDVLANDSDVDGNPISLFSQTTTNGTLSVVGTNLFFTPASNYLGQVVLSYTITDGSAFASALVFVNVTAGTNTPPVATDDAVSIPEDTTLTFDPLGNDFDPDADPFFISNVTTTNGTASVLGGTNVVYLPPTNFNGTISLVYTISDGNGGTDSAIITVTVIPVNDAPVANDQSVSTLEDTALPITLTGTDVESDPLTYILVSGPTNGALSGFNTNTGALTYTPTTDYIGADAFTFRVDDGTTNSAVATVSITVTPVNDAPIANGQSVTTVEDTALPITLTGSDVEGDPLTFILVSSPANGSLSGFDTNTGALTYTPATNYTGADSFTFRVNDGTSLSSVATVNLTVTPVNDAPFANDQSVSTPEDTALLITLTGSDVEGTPLTYILVGGPANGALSGFNTNTGALTYTPNTNYNGADSFTFRVSDGTNTSNVATVSITVTPANDVPFANDQSVSTLEDTALPITLTGLDLEGDPLTYILVSGPVNGALSGFNTNTGALTYTPNTNYTGADSFTFRTSDGTNTSAVATVSITITPVNDLPSANSQSLSTPEDTALPIALTGSDVEGGPLTFILASGPANGSLSGFDTNTGAITYTPATNYIGADSFSFRTSDGTNTSAVATVNITVTPVNDAPVAVSDFATTAKNVPVTLLVLLNDFDVDGDTLTITTATPTNGIVSIIGGTNLFFTPASNFVGIASVGYTITDGNGGFSTAPGAVTITVGTNVPPIANDDTNSTPEDTALTFDPRLNDIDPDGDPMTVTLASATNGTVSILGGTNLLFTPATNFNGTATIGYTISDGQGGTASAVVTVIVTPVNDAPFANGQNLTTPEDTALPITLTGSDVEATALTFILVGSPTNGVISGFNTNTGAVTYSPNANYNGADSFTFQVNDGTNTSAIAVIGIIVTPVNDVPFANGQNLTTPEDTALPITLTGSDVEGTALTYVLVGAPSNGAITGFNTNTGALTYRPNTNYTGSDSFTFRTSDGTNSSAVATVSITVTPLNDAPFANNQSVSTPEDTALPITLTGSDVEGTALTFILVGSPTNGVISGFNTNTGALTYSPNTNYTGPDSFTFRVNDGTNTSAVAFVTVAVTPVNDAPFANSQSRITPEDTALPVTLTGSDVEGNALTFILVSGSTNGVITGFNTNTGALTYTPDTNYVGGDSFTFSVNDGTNTSAIATVGITVTPVNDAPSANGQSLTTPEDTALPITLTGSDVEGTPLTYVLVGTPSNGVLIGINTNTGALTYRPNTNYTGSDSFTFRTSDGTNASAVATVNITVTPVNDAPFANGQNLTTPEDTALLITLTGSDVEGTALTFVLVGSPTNGSISGFNTNTGVLSYAPNTNYNGGDAFTFRTSDGTNLSSVATVSIIVTPANDAPIANGQSVTTPEDTALPVTLTGSDVEGGSLTFNLVSSPASGVIIGFNTNTGALTYRPNTNYTGSDSITFRTSDGTNSSALATVSITVTPVNDAPFANNQNVITTEDTAAPITLTGSDVEGTPLTYILVGSPVNGALSAFNTNTGALTYLPNTNYNGGDSFTFRVNDGTNVSAVATVTITVIPIADEPRSVPQGLTTPEDTALPITLIGTSPDGNPLTYQLISAPTHGAFVSFNTNSGVLTYQPNTNYNGFDAFTFRVSDGFTNSLVATVNITVTPVNDLPILRNDVTNTPSGQPVVISPLVNDTDPDGGVLAISCMSSTNGTAVVSGTNIIFTSASNFVGTVTITYCATNLTGGSGSAIITVFVPLPPIPTFSLFQGTNSVNPQTGLFEQRVTITNSGISTASAVQLLVGNINSPLGVPRTNVWLYNATGTNVDARPYALYNAPLDPGQFVTLTLEFVVPDRRPFTNSLEAVSVLPTVGSTGITNIGGGVLIDRWFKDNRFSGDRYVLEWASLPGRTYTVIYSDDNMATWRAATPTVRAVNNRTQWYDDGPPKTVSPPPVIGSRYYRIILNP